MKKFKFAFTVSEMLVCLAIIACISAMLIPNVVNKKPNQNKAIFRKSYYLVERVVTEILKDEDLYPNDMGDRQGLAYFDTETYTEENNNTGQQFCEEFAKRVNTVGTVDCENAHLLAIDSSTTPTFTTNDGVNWYFGINRICDPTADNDLDCYVPKTSSSTSFLRDILLPVAYAAGPSASGPPTGIPVITPAEGSGFSCAKSNYRNTYLSYACIEIDVNGSNVPNTFDDVKNVDRFKIYVFYNGKVHIEKNSPGASYLDTKTIY